MNEKEKIKMSQEEYKKFVEDNAPKSDTFKNCIRAFLVGGTICTIAEYIKNIYISFGIAEKEASTYTSVTLIFIAILLTGLGIYQKLGTFAGAGSVVPITGFANSVASPAIEFKKEGYIMGVGAKMFVIAGPVILYSTVTSIIVGVLYYFFK